MYRKITFLFVCYCACFFALHSMPSKLYAQAEERPYDLVIGLGDMCQVAFQLSTHNQTFATFPFDWVLTPFESLYSFLASEGAFFLDIDKLIFVTGKPSYLNATMTYIEDTVYHIQFLHDFALSPDFLKNYYGIKAKYDRRLKRLLNELHSTKKILFIRRGISYQQAILLDNLLHNLYPQLTYTIVALDSTEEIKQDWKLGRVKNLYLRELSPWQWYGDTQAWLEILSQFPIKPCSKKVVID